VRYGQAAGRWVLLATALGSGLAFIDATVVNIALPRIGTSLHAGAAGLQWTVNGYTLSLTALILLGGSLGDRFGRRRVFVIGVGWFAAASLLCGLAPNIQALIAARVLQGVGGALLAPGALAILEASFQPQDRARAIGAWSGMGGIAGALGPFLGGWLVQAASWRLVFLINVHLAAVVAVVALRHVPETRNPAAARRLDLAGVLTGAGGLAGLTYGFTAWPALGATSPTVLVALGLGVAGMLGFVFTERHSSHPMLPLEVFASRAFTAANLVTFAVYAALGGVLFLVVLNLQVVAGFAPLAAGTALLPVTVLMLLLSARAGALAQRIASPRASEPAASPTPPPWHPPTESRCCSVRASCSAAPRRPSPRSPPSSAASLTRPVPLRPGQRPVPSDFTAPSQARRSIRPRTGRCLNTDRRGAGSAASMP
jgi:EmrB/QacA subfamily drug resistance transporter